MTKKEKIFNEGFKLFKKKGVESTTIQEIVDNAGTAKGTFYLYFKDKYDLKEQLITKKSYCESQMNKLYPEVRRELNPHEYKVSGTKEYVDAKEKLINEVKERVYRRD